VKKVRESRLAMPNADFDMLIAESMTLVVSRDLGRGLRRGTLEEEASKESSSLSLERAMRILERGRREDEGMVALKKVVVVDGAMVHRVGGRDGDGDGDQISLDRQRESTLEVHDNDNLVNTEL
jgi:hypothetical protein